MSENDDTTQQPQSSTFEVISHLTNIPLAPDPSKSNFSNKFLLIILFR